MKRFIVFAAMLAIAASCNVSEMESEKVFVAPEFTASFADNGTKTTITTDEDGLGTIWWTPADEINIFFEMSSGEYLNTRYVSKNTANSTYTSFGRSDFVGGSDSGETLTSNIWALYPYDEDAECDGSSVTTTIPNVQYAVADAFDDDLFTSVARTLSSSICFHNVLGGIKFSLSRDDIQSITFKGNQFESLAGKAQISMDEDDTPVAKVYSGDGEETITLTPKEGTTFAKNTNYYIVMLPTLLVWGFTMTFETATQIGTFENKDYPIEIKRSVFRKKENIDNYATFVSK